MQTFHHLDDDYSINALCSWWRHNSSSANHYIVGLSHSLDAWMPTTHSLACVNDFGDLVPIPRHLVGDALRTSFEK